MIGRGHSPRTHTHTHTHRQHTHPQSISLKEYVGENPHSKRTELASFYAAGEQGTYFIVFATNALSARKGTAKGTAKGTISANTYLGHNWSAMV